MIKYSLTCENFHRFDSWFASSDGFEKLRGQGMLTCEVCGSIEISKSLMTPQVNSKSKDQISEFLKKPNSKEEKFIAELKKKIEETCEYVGENFSEEARAIQNGASPTRGIYGKTTEKEAKALYEDGIPIVPLPWTDRKSN